MALLPACRAKWGLFQPLSCLVITASFLWVKTDFVYLGFPFSAERLFIHCLCFMWTDHCTGMSFVIVFVIFFLTGSL